MENEKRLIDANALLDYLRKDKHESEVIEAVKDAPTVDAVEVIRCIDCKWYETKNVNLLPHCILCGVTKCEDDFCSCGERREGE